MSLSIKKGDNVVVLAGKDKGKTGRVLEIDGTKVIVEGVNLVKKHQRRRTEGDTGGIKEIPASMARSKVALMCSNCNKGVRFSVKINKDNTKVRVCKKCQKEV